ncbi:MAG TPA: YXWGXW repeat-containing protein [Polyangia bacterium]|nr:YXWGXW repeat-containing protein [Polyangia bacterium]
MKRDIWKVGVLGLGIWLCAAPASSLAAVVIRTGPPVVHEVVPAPRPGFVWDPAHYDYRGGRYVLVQGHFIPERRGFVWVPGRWENQRGAYVWVAGMWRPVR